jgi:hypothetical protein
MLKTKRAAADWQVRQMPGESGTLAINSFTTHLGQDMLRIAAPYLFKPSANSLMDRIRQ